MLVTPEYGNHTRRVHVEHRLAFDRPETNASGKSHALLNGATGHNAPRRATVHPPARVTLHWS
jgi:hypothetical protein